MAVRRHDSAENIGFAHRRAGRDRGRIRAFVDAEVVPHEPALLAREGVSWDVVAGAARAGARGRDLRPAASEAPRRARAGLARRRRHLRGGRHQPARAAGAELRRARRGQHAPAGERRDARAEGEVPGAAGGRRDPLLLRHDRAGPGAGADPTMLRSRARRDGDDWVIDGHKWYITGADGAAFAIVMARTSDDPDPRRGATMFLVDAGTPGFEIVRHIPSLDRTFPGGHCEVRFTDCRVPSDAILGEADFGFDYAQVAAGAGPADPLHALARAWRGGRWRSPPSTPSSGPAAARRSASTRWSRRCWPTPQIDLDAARLLIWRACWELDQGRAGAWRELGRQGVRRRGRPPGGRPRDSDLRRARDQRGPAAQPVLPRGPAVPHLRRPQRGPPGGRGRRVLRQAQSRLKARRMTRALDPAMRRARAPSPRSVERGRCLTPERPAPSGACALPRRPSRSSAAASRFGSRAIWRRPVERHLPRDAGRPRPSSCGDRRPDRCRRAPTTSCASTASSRRWPRPGRCRSHAHRRLRRRQLSSARRSS